MTSGSAARHSHFGEGAHRGGRDAGDGDVGRAGRDRAVRRPRGGASPRGRSGDRRHQHDDGHVLARDVPVQLGCGSAQPLGSGPCARMVELGRGSRGRIADAADHDRVGRRRLHPLARRLLRTRRASTRRQGSCPPTTRRCRSDATPPARSGRSPATRATPRSRCRRWPGPDGRDFDCIQADAPDCVTSLDAGVNGMRVAWTDDYGFTDMYAFEREPACDRRPFVTRRSASPSSAPSSRRSTTRGRTSGTGTSPRTTSSAVVPPARWNARSREQWIRAMDVRDRNWQRVPQRSSREHDVLLERYCADRRAHDRRLGRLLGGQGSGPIPARDVRAPLHEPHPHVQLARVPRRQRAGRVRRRPSRRSPDRRLAGH